MLERGEIARKSVENNAVIYITEDLDSAFEIANEIAPEHLELELEDAKSYLEKVEYAGAVLLGKYSPNRSETISQVLTIRCLQADRQSMPTHSAYMIF